MKIPQTYQSSISHHYLISLLLPLLLPCPSKHIKITTHQIHKPIRIPPRLQIPNLLIRIRNERPTHQKQRLFFVQVQQHLDVAAQVEQRRVFAYAEAGISRKVQHVGLYEAFEVALGLFLEDDAQDLVGGATALAEDALTALLALLRVVFGLEGRLVFVWVVLAQKIHYTQQINQQLVDMGQTPHKLTPQPQQQTLLAHRDTHKIVQNGSKLLFKYQFTYLNEPDHLNSLAHLQHGRSLQHKHLQQLIAHRTTKHDNFCSSVFRVAVYYEYCQQSLELEVEARRQAGLLFAQKELWSILCSCTLAMAYLEGRRERCGEIGPGEVWLTGEGVVKVRHPTLVGNSGVFREDGYYAPEQLAGGMVDQYKCGVFQLGLILLRCCNCEDTRVFYDAEGRLDANVIGEFLVKAAGRYEQAFVDTLFVMIQQRVEVRPRWSQLQALILSTVSGNNMPQQEIMQLQQPQQTLMTFAPQGPEPPSQSPAQYPPDAQHIDQIQSSLSIQHQQQLCDSNILKNSTNTTTPINKLHPSTTSHKHQSTQKPSSSFQPSTSLKSGQYQGQTLHNLRQGYGTFHYSQGGIYTGQWQQGEMHGHGTLYYQSGKMAYEGEWQHDKLHGKGVLYNEEVVKLHTRFDCRDFNRLGDYWVKYEGEFREDNREGMGRLVLSNGEYFLGRFQGDEVNGAGTFYRTDGSVVKGIWVGNIKQN